MPDLLALTPELADDDRQPDLPLGSGPVYPYLAAIHDAYEPLPRRRVRSTLTHDLSRADRVAVYDTWDQAHDWTTRWLNDRAEWLDQDAADAILALARRGDTDSEIYVRIRAALDAFQHAGVTTNVRAVTTRRKRAVHARPLPLDLRRPCHSTCARQRGRRE